MADADPYWRFPSVAPPERESVPRSTFPGYAYSESSFLTSNHLRGSSDLRGGASDILQGEILPLRPGPYGSGDPSLAYAGLASGPSLHGLPASLEEHSLVSRRRDVSLGIYPDSIEDTRRSLIKADEDRQRSLVTADDASANTPSMLFVDGLPKDCTRREVSHLFRPFIGFKDIKVVHRGARKSGDKAMVLCFVEFSDAKCALTAMDALQGYRFDIKNPESSALKIQFAQFPFNLPSTPSHESRDNRRHESRDDRRNESRSDRRHESRDVRRNDSRDDRDDRRARVARR